jgi:tetratricopeptide (TPR) repeat protein
VNEDWEKRVADAWASIEEYYDGREEEFRALIDGLAAELPAGSAIADFERACAWDSTGHSDQAVPLYRRALETGLTGIRRRRAVIQLSSSLRNIGRPEESVRLLTAEMAAGSDELDDAVKCTLALALTDLGREREALSLVIGALARHLPRYQRSMANYARLLMEPNPDA